MKVSHIGLYCALLCQEVLSDDNQRPNEMFCPITRDVMRDPVVASDTYSYERVAIEEHLKRDHCSPKTGKRLTHHHLTANHALKSLILEWTGERTISSPFVGKDSITMLNLIQNAFTHCRHLIHVAKDKDIVVFWGNTGSGKSTLINLLSGATSSRKNNNPPYQTLPPLFECATSGDPQTLYPNYVVVDTMLFFEIPAIDHTDGSARNLINSAFIRQILISAASVRFVFVVGEDEFHVKRGTSVKCLWQTLAHVLGPDVLQEKDAFLTKGLLICTKSTFSDEKKAFDHLSQCLTGDRLHVMHHQLHCWQACQRIGYSPVHLHSHTQKRLGALIVNIPRVHIDFLNSAWLYPLEQQGPLIRLFGHILEQKFIRHTSLILKTLSDYDKAHIWCAYFANLDENENGSMERLLQDFCQEAYLEAQGDFTKTHDIEQYRAFLRHNRKKRLKLLVWHTHRRTRKHLEEESHLTLPVHGVYPQGEIKKVVRQVRNEVSDDLDEQKIIGHICRDFIKNYHQQQINQWTLEDTKAFHIHFKSKLTAYQQSVEQRPGPFH